MSIYADTSLLVSLYVTDAHSQEAHRRVAHRPRIWLTSLHRVEWAHAIAQHLFRRALTSQEAAQIYTDFEADRASGVWLEAGVPDAAYETAVQLAKHYGPRLGVRTLDTLHVAAARELGALEFWTFDQQQKKLAEAAGLTTR